MCWIGNVNKMEISINGSQTRADGRLAVSFHDPQLPLTSRAVAKSSLACTTIYGSNAAGECIPPHWQLSMCATAKEREKLRFEFLSHILYTHGRFDYEEERSWPAMIGINEKGGMADNEFEEYIKNSIWPIYPDMEDTPGKHMLSKVDSGPGRNGKELLMKCQLHGLCIYPGLPNATSVQQEMDINYSPFKSIAHNNLKGIASAFYALGEDIPLGGLTLGLIVYGGTIPVGTTNIMCHNALTDVHSM